MSCHFLLWGSSRPRDQARFSCIAGQFFYNLSHQRNPSFASNCLQMKNSNRDMRRSRSPGHPGTTPGLPPSSDLPHFFLGMMPLSCWNALTCEHVLICCDRMIKSILRSDCWTLDSRTQWNTGEQHGFSISEFRLSVYYWALESDYFSTSRFFRTDYNSQVFKISFMENSETWNHNPVFPFNTLDHLRENSIL